MNNVLEVEGLLQDYILLLNRRDSRARYYRVEVRFIHDTDPDRKLYYELDLNPEESYYTGCISVPSGENDELVDCLVRLMKYLAESHGFVEFPWDP